VLKEYNQAENSLKRIELRLEKLQDNGASDEELALLHEGIKIVDELQDEQQTALESLERGEDAQAVACSMVSPMSRSLSARRTSSITSARYSTSASSPPFRRRQKIESAAYRL
jgi:predicted secreted protein